MGRKAINKERKKLTIKAELWLQDLFYKLQDKDLDVLTLDEIAELIHISKSTIYTYFRTKEEIYSTIVERILEKLESLTYEKLFKGIDLLREYERLLLNICKIVQHISIHFLENIKLNFPDIWKKVNSCTNKILNTFMLLYKRGMSNGTFNVYNIELLLIMDENFIMNVITNSKAFSKEQLTLNELVNQYLVMRKRALVCS